MSNTFDRLIIGDLVGIDCVLRDEIIAVIGHGAPSPAMDRLDHRGRLILPGLVGGYMHSVSAIGWPRIKGAPTQCRYGWRDDLPHPVTDA